jgi:hypothetical protein
MTKQKVIEIPVADVVAPEAEQIHLSEHYPRLRPNFETVHSYELSIDELPPIIIDEQNVLIDGWHRLEAHRQQNRETIKAIRIKLGKKEPLIAATEYNARHGLGLNRDEKIALAERFYLGFDMSAEEIADILAVDRSTAYRWLESLKDDRENIMKQRAIEMLMHGATNEQVCRELGLVEREKAKTSTVHDWWKAYLVKLAREYQTRRQTFEKFKSRVALSKTREKTLKKIWDTVEETIKTEQETLSEESQVRQLGKEEVPTQRTIDAIAASEVGDTVIVDEDVGTIEISRKEIVKAEESNICKGFSPIVGHQPHDYWDKGCLLCSNFEGGVQGTSVKIRCSKNIEFKIEGAWAVH